MKQVDPAALGRALDKCLAPAVAPAPFTVILRDGRELKKVLAGDILYCQSEGRKVHVHGPGWKITGPGKLGDLAGRLPAGFIPTHNRYLVNLAHVAALTREALRLDDGQEISVSRAYRDRVAEACRPRRGRGPPAMTELPLNQLNLMAHAALTLVVTGHLTVYLNFKPSRLRAVLAPALVVTALTGKPLGTFLALMAIVPGSTPGSLSSAGSSGCSSS